MNFYPLEFEEQSVQGIEQQCELTDEQLYYEFDQSAQMLPEQLNTFDGYIQEEPVVMFNFVEEAPKKKSRNIIRKTKKIRKADSETEGLSVKKSKINISNGDFVKLQQCQRLKSIICQMESLLQKTRSQILNEYIKNK